MPNICIIPSGDRQGQANLIHHYSKIGWDVYFPKHGTGNLNWKKTATWPGLLCRSLRNPDQRNLDIHGFERTEDNIFGEDRFIQLEDNGPLCKDRSIACELVDFEKEKVSIDAFHTLRGSDDYFENAMGFAQKHFPNSTWITSTIFSDHHLPGKANPKNVCKMLPANYDLLYKNVNYFDFYPSGFEFDLLNVKRNQGQRSGYASFNHNYQIRYPKDYRMLKKLNEILEPFNIFIQNYGGNTSGQGADIKYSEKGNDIKNIKYFLNYFKYYLQGARDINKRWPTLSMREAAMLNTQIKAIINFKQADYGGGVVWYALISGTPIITHQKYIDATHAHNILIDDYNSIVVNDAESAARTISRLENDPEYGERLSLNMQNTFTKLLDSAYWIKWENFIKAALKNN